MWFSLLSTGVKTAAALYKNKKEGFVVGGNKKEKITTSKVTCSDNPCKNNGKCIDGKVMYSE